MIHIRLEQFEITAVRKEAAGQNINKVSNGTHLCFDFHASSLANAIKERLRNATGGSALKASRVWVKERLTPRDRAVSHAERRAASLRDAVLR